MQRFNNFTKKSGKVASAILSAAMVTSMLAGTNVVYAATEATEATTDVATKVTATDEEKATKAIATLKENYKDFPVTVYTDGSESNFTDATKKVKDDLELDSEPEVNYIVTTQPTATKAGEALLTIKVETTTGSAITTGGAIKDSLKYTLASGKDRAVAAKAVAQKYVDEELVLTNQSDANKISDEVTENLTGKKDGEISLYEDVKYKQNNLVITPADGDKRGTVTGTISFMVVDGEGTQIGGFDVTVDKEVLTDQEVADAAKEELDKYIDGVKYFNSTTYDKDAVEKVAKTYCKNKNNGVETSAVTAGAIKTAGKTITGETSATITLENGEAKAKIENKTITIPSDNEKVESVLADFVKYAKSVSVDEKTTEEKFVEAVVKNFSEDNKDINVGDETLDNLDKAYSVYGNNVKVEVNFTETKEAKDDKPVATIKVTVGDTIKTAIVDTFGVKAEESKGSFEEKDGKKYYYDANGNTLQNTYLQGTDSPDGYTYYIQADGSVMQDRLTYTPDGKYIIYFDEDGHEVFDAFVNVKKDMQGNDVDYIAYFDTFGHAYTNITTYGNGEGTYSKDSLFYINDYGVLQTNGWFKNAEGNIGYAAENGALTTSQWGVDQFGRKVYFQANGFLAKGLITDGVKYYQLDENDGHLVGEF